MKASLQIGNRTIGHDTPLFMIAEIGINHNGDEQEAAWLIDCAADIGADAVKFQTVEVESSYAEGTASHQEFGNRSLSREAYQRLMVKARSRDLIMFSTPGDLQSLDLMVAVGMPCIKISSGQMTNVPLLRAAAQTGLPLLISTGMSDLKEVRATVQCVRESGANDIALLHCTSLYPAPIETLNLRAIATLRNAFEVPVGYSDHHNGDLASIAALAAGACLIEKHFTRDCTQDGADHALSLEPFEFAAMIKKLRSVEVMLGSREKAPVPEELRFAPERRRYLVARRDLAAGNELSEDDVVGKRVLNGSNGIPAMAFDSVLGRRLRRFVRANDLLTESDLENER